MLKKRHAEMRERLLKGTVVSVEDILDYVKSDRYLSVRSAAAFLDFEQKFIRKQLKRIPHVRIDGEIRIRKSLLAEWAESYRVAPAGRTAKEIADQVAHDMGID